MLGRNFIYRQRKAPTPVFYIGYYSGTISFKLYGMENLDWFLFNPLVYILMSAPQY